MLDQIQAHLEAIYGLTSTHKASQFLVGADEARALGSEPKSREELLVSHTGEDLELALYIEPTMLDRVTQYEAAPVSALDEGLREFCEVAEGVSHFLYLTHTAEQNRTVSMLELEAQAEVDKFVMCTFLKWGRDVASWTSTLSTRLFDQVSYSEALSHDERFRYVEANRMAKRYVQRLLPLVRRHDFDRLLSEVRHAYRLGAEAKLQYFSKSV